MASGKVLILDESHATRTQLRELLPKGQYEIQEASDGERGLSLIQQERSNIRFIILDSALPKVNGWDVVERLQADVELQKIPLVMMGSAKISSSSYPMVEFLQKPFRKKELRTVVKSAIGKAISVHQETGNDRQEEFVLSSSDRQEIIIEESIATVQTPEEGAAIDLDNMFESFVESERDRAESDEFSKESAEAMESSDPEERELDFSFDTTGTDEAIEREEIAALGLSFPSSDPAIATEDSPENLEFEVEPTEIEPAVEIDLITSLEGKREEREADFSFDTTGTDETIDTREFEDIELQSDTLPFSSALDSQDIVDALDDEEPEIDEFPSLDIDLSTEDLTPEIDEFPSLDIDLSVDALDDEEPEIDEFPSLDINLSTEDLNPEIDEFPSLDIDLSVDTLDDEEPEIDEFPSLGIDLSTEDLTPEIDEFPSLDIDSSTEDLSPKIDKFSSLDINLSTEDLTPEIDEFPSLDIDSSTEDLSSEIDEFPSLDISTEEVENQFHQEEAIDIEDEQEETSENFEFMQNYQRDLDRQDLEEELGIEENTELSSSDNMIFNREENEEDRQKIENISPSFELEELSDETDSDNDTNDSKFSVEELLTPVHEWSEDDFTAEYESEETEALINESFADLGAEELAIEIPEAEEDNFTAEYTSEETEALINESFADLGAEELATEIPAAEEDNFTAEYTSEETEALIDESFADLGAEELATEIPETEEDNFTAEYTSEETEALIDESFADLGIDELFPPTISNDESELETRLISRDRLPTDSPLAEVDNPIENTSEEPEDSDIKIFDEENELSIFAEDFPQELEREIEPYNTSDEDIREDYYRTQSENESFFDSSLTLNPAEEIQYPTEDTFSTPTPELQSEESLESTDSLFASPPPTWEEQTNVNTDGNESESIFNPSLQLDEENIAYPAEADDIFPPLGETDLFEPEATPNESFFTDAPSPDSFGGETFDGELTADTPSFEEEEEYTILEDKRSHTIPLPDTSTPSEEPEEEHTILEDKRNPKVAQPFIESPEETENSESEQEFTVLEDKRNVDPADRSLDYQQEPDPDLVSLEAENPLRLNKIFTESDREIEVSHLVNLSGFEDVLMRYKSTVEEVKISALKEAFDYDEPGYRLIFNALREESSEIRQTAEQLLIEHLKKPRVQVLPVHENWASFQCLHTLRGHSYWVQDVAIAPDGRTVISGSKDGTIKIWDILTGREVRSLNGHESAVLSVKIATDGERIISCGTDNTIKIWSLDTGTELNTIPGKAHKVYTIALSPNGKSVVSASADNTIKPKYNGGLEAFLNRIPSRRVNALLSLIGVLKRSPAIKIWDLDKGKPQGNFRGYSRGVTDLAVSPKGDKVVSGSRDRTIKIWDFKTGKNIDTLWGHNDEIRSVAISPDGKTIISGSRDRTIKIWDMQSGHVLRTLRGHGQSVTCVAVSPDGNIIVSGSRDSSIKIWDFHTGEFINTLLGHTDLVRSIAIDADGKTIVSGSRDNTIKVWGNVF